MPTTSREDYLRGLFVLEEQYGGIKSVDLAKYLKVSKPSVSEMMKTLDREGLVDYKRYSMLKFTKKGKEVAEKLTKKHRVIELFLKNILKANAKNIHEEAHRLEHAFSDESINKIQTLLGNPKEDPHGKPIPQ